MPKPARFAICVRNAGVRASLELRKVYRLVADAAAASQGLVRVVDESGEDYLYPDTIRLSSNGVRTPCHLHGRRGPHCRDERLRAGPPA